MARSKYDVIKFNREGAILISDVGHNQGYKSVTNDAEDVVAEILTSYGYPDMDIFYYDSEGELGQLLTRNGKFSGFAPASEDILSLSGLI